MSYAPIDELALIGRLDRRWLFNDHGHRTLEWDDHCNCAHTPWILREHGITLTGPAPRSFIPIVPAEVLRQKAARSLPTILGDLATWLDIDSVAWGQRYVVVTACRILYTFETATVASKQGALKWTVRTLERRWQPLLAQVRDECSLGWEPDRAPRAGEVDAGRMFMGYVLTRAQHRGHHRPERDANGRPEVDR